MNPLLLGPVLEIGKTLLDRFGPEDRTERAKLDAEFFRMTYEGDLRNTIAQLEINAKEATHPSLWVAGWRPYFGWVGGTAFAYVGLLQPLLSWLSAVKGWPVPPDVDTEFLWVVVSGLLGIGGLRTFEKTKKVAK